MSTTICNSDTLAKAVDAVRRTLTNLTADAAESSPSREMHVGISHEPGNHFLLVSGQEAHGSVSTRLPALEPAGPLSTAWQVTLPESQLSAAVIKTAGNSIIFVTFEPSTQALHLNDGSPGRHIILAAPGAAEERMPLDFPATTQAVVDANELATGLETAAIPEGSHLTGVISGKRIKIYGNGKGRSISWTGAVAETNRRGRPARFSIGWQQATAVADAMRRNPGRAVIGFDDGTVAFTTTETVIVCPQLAETPDFPSPPWFMSQWAFETDDIYRAVAASTLTAERAEHPVTLTSGKGRVEVRAALPESSLDRQVNKCETSGLDRSITVRGHHLLAAINASGDRRTLIRIAGDHDPVTVQPDKVGNVRHLIFPMLSAATHP